MSTLPWLPWYHRDFLAATQGWTLLERGAYFMLLGAQWEIGPLPNDRRRLAGIIGAQLDELESVWPVVGAKFEVADSGLVNRRLEEHRARQIDRSEKARESARNRWKKNANAYASGDGSGHANAYALDVANSYATSMLPKPEPETEAEPKQEQKTALPSTADAVARMPRRQTNGLDRELERQILDAYHELCPHLPAVREWNERRHRKLSARIRERVTSGKPANTINYWRALFAKAAASDFLGGHKIDWRCPGLEWLLEPKHFTRLLEGGYDNTGGGDGRR